MNYLLNQHKSGGVLYDSEFMQVLSTGEMSRGGGLSRAPAPTDC